MNLQSDQRGVCEEKIIKCCKQTRIAVLLLKQGYVALTQSSSSSQPLHTAPLMDLSYARRQILYIHAPGGCRMITQRITDKNFLTFVSVKSQP